MSEPFRPYGISRALIAVAALWVLLLPVVLFWPSSGAQTVTTTPEPTSLWLANPMTSVSP